jgi:hypothetical protein
MVRTAQKCGGAGKSLSRAIFALVSVSACLADDHSPVRVGGSSGSVRAKNKAAACGGAGQEVCGAYHRSPLSINTTTLSRGRPVFVLCARHRTARKGRRPIWPLQPYFFWSNSEIGGQLPGRLERQHDGADVAPHCVQLRKYHGGCSDPTADVGARVIRLRILRDRAPGVTLPPINEDAPRAPRAQPRAATFHQRSRTQATSGHGHPRHVRIKPDSQGATVPSSVTP